MSEGQDPINMSPDEKRPGAFDASVKSDNASQDQGKHGQDPINISPDEKRPRAFDASSQDQEKHEQDVVQVPQLQRRLKSRHLQMIAIGKSKS